MVLIVSGYIGPTERLIEHAGSDYGTITKQLEELMFFSGWHFVEIWVAN